MFLACAPISHNLLHVARVLCCSAEHASRDSEQPHRDSQFLDRNSWFCSALILWCWTCSTRKRQWFKCVLLLSPRLLVYLKSCLWTPHYKILKSVIPMSKKLVFSFRSVLNSEWQYQIKLDRGWCSEAVEKQIGSDPKVYFRLDTEYFDVRDCNMQNSSWWGLQLQCAFCSSCAGRVVGEKVG